MKVLAESTATKNTRVADAAFDFDGPTQSTASAKRPCKTSGTSENGDSRDRPKKMLAVTPGLRDKNGSTNNASLLS